jgi:ribonuclease BN (tRNA processing enzyme)
MNDKSLIFTVLGSGTAIPYENRVSASYLLSFDDKNILLDTGFYVVYQLNNINHSLDDLDAIFISHKHPDHFMGFIHILFALNSPYYEKRKKIKVFGFKGLKDFIDDFSKIIGKWIPLDNVEIIENPADEFLGISYNLFPMIHTQESVGIRLSVKGKSVFYTGDTEYFDDLPKYALDSDLLIVDCASPLNTKIKGHMDYLEGIKVAEKAKVKRLLLSHFYPGTDDIDIYNPDYEFEIIKARDLMKIYL